MTEYHNYQDYVAEFFLHYVLPSFNAFLITGITLTTAKLRLSQDLHIFWCGFFPLQIILNWIQFVRNRSVIPTSLEPFPGLINRPVDNHSQDISINMNFTQKLRYKECYPCHMYVPSRSHHCPYCRKCIYVLDHHCFFLGYCVGRQNLQYFILFCVYAALGTAYGLFHIMDAMSYYRDASSKESIFFFFPFIFVMYLCDRAAGFEVFYVFLLDFGLGACLISIFLSGMGLFSVFNGTTPYEDRRNIKLNDSSGAVRKFEEVFGRRGFLKLLLPVLPIPGPTVLTGYRKQ